MALFFSLSAMADVVLGDIKFSLADGKKISPATGKITITFPDVTGVDDPTATSFVLAGAFNDEAFDGLDPAMRKVIKNMIVDEMLDRQATLIVSSHNIAEINELCDRAMLIHKGKLIFSGELDEISSGFRKVQLARKNLPVSREELEQLGLEVMQSSISGSVTQAVIRGTEDKIMSGLSALKTDITEIIPLTLEEIFIYELEARGYGSEYVPEN